MKRENDTNMLDCVPMKKATIGTRLTDAGLTQLVVKHDNAVKKFFRHFVHIPEATTIDLDGYGSFVWNAIDGTNDVHDIGLLLREKFGEGVEPLFERLCGYVWILKSNGFIDFVR